MQKIKRRPNGPVSYGVNAKEALETKKFNKVMRYVQGFRTIINNGSNTLNITLNSPGKKLLGISIVPVGTGDISDTQISLLVNNNSVLTEVASQNINPQYVQSMIYFPLPQPLQGNDNFTFTIKKNDVNTITAIIDIFYVPQ